MFEAVALGVGGADFYRKALVDLDDATLRGMINKNAPGRDWNLASAMVINGEAAMQIMGDWAKGEFTNAGKVSGDDCACIPVPKANGQAGFTYLVNSLSLFTQTDPDLIKGQKMLASAIMDPAVMNKGYVQQLGTPKDIYDTPANLFVATFMGSPAMNIMPAKLVQQNGAPHAEITDADGAMRHLRFSQDNLADWAGREVLLGIRPEAIADPEGADRKSGNIQAFANRVTVTEPAGSYRFVTMTLGGRDAIARMRADASTAPGEIFDFAINMEKAVVFDPVTELRIPA